MTALNILSGIKIASFTQFLLGPAGTQYLADMGADVVKVEPPGGASERNHAGLEVFLNGISAFQMATHRNTRCIALNLKKPQGHEAALQLAAQADVVIQNARPGVMDRLGLGYEDVRKVNPHVIYVSASGYGDKGPGRNLPGQDLVMQALTGLCDVTGRGDDAPVAAGAPIVDQHGGALLALGVVSALFHRSRTGEGQHVRLSMLQAALDLQLEPATYALNGHEVHRSNYGLANGYSEAPYGIYKTADSYIVLSASPIKLYYDAIKDDRLLPFIDPRAIWEKKGEIRAVFESIMPTKTTAEWVEMMRPFSIWMQAVCTYEECFAHPAVQAAEPVMTVEHPIAGRVNLLKPPITFGSGEMEVRYFTPALGEHTVEVLRELGFSEDKIRAMQEDQSAIVG